MGARPILSRLHLLGLTGPPSAVCLTLGASAGAARLSASGGALEAWDLALRAGAGAWIVWALASTLWECIQDPVRAACAEDTAAGRLASRVLGVSALLITAALLRAPERLLVNVLGFLLVGGALLWGVRRRATGVVTLRASLAFGLLAFVPTHLDASQAPQIRVSEPASHFRWSVGWPTDEWGLAHEMVVDRPLSPAHYELWVQHAGLHQVPGRIEVSFNGQPLGPLEPRGQDWLMLDLPASQTAGLTRLRFELRQRGRSEIQRLTAQRWSGGATLGAAASSYFDGLTWRSGTFDDVTGEARPGLYVMELRGPVWRTR